MLIPAQSLGYNRTLQASDLYKMDVTREAKFLADELERSWERRVRKANEWNAKLLSGETKPGLRKKMGWAVRAIRGANGTTWSDRMAVQERNWREVGGRKEASLAWALNDVLGMNFWISAAFKVSMR